MMRFKCMDIRIMINGSLMQMTLPILHHLGLMVQESKNLNR
jgi:hypothetical protein